MCHGNSGRTLITNSSSEVVKLLEEQKLANQSRQQYDGLLTNNKNFDFLNQIKL